MAHPNVDLITRAYELFGRGDMENLQNSWADDIVWHISGDTRISGNHAGTTSILTMFGQLPVHLTTNVRRVDGAGFSLHRATAEKGGESYEFWEVLSYRFVDGLVAEIWRYPFDQAADEQLFA